jgi:DNA replication protein DnaC
LGNKACQEGFRVLYTGTAKFIGQFKIAKAKATFLSELKRIERMDMLILDDFGMQGLDQQASGILMDIIEDRHGKRSTLIASQLVAKQWHDVIGERNVADAILDRIVHHALRVELADESIRKRKIKTESVFL